MIVLIKYLPLSYEPLKDHLVKKGDVIVSRMNTKELVGAAAYVWNVQENTYLPDRLWRVDYKKNVNPIFLWNLLISPEIKEEIRKVAAGTSGSMKNISKKLFLEIETKEIPVNLQNKFADKVKLIDKSKFVVQKSIKKSFEMYSKVLLLQDFRKRGEKNV
ncbi:hypothetical protein [Fusobacterium sp. PH5-44]|uniref:hypothetical protein n=1 Tax=unclassified Fusobacterium TaxID=2648384 RepID=UPI003D1A363C